MYLQIKQMLTIRQVLTAYGIKIRKNRAICPYHKEKRASLVIFDRTQTAICMTCRTGGDIITTVSKLFHITNYESAKKLSNDFNLGIYGELTDEELEKFKKQQEQRKLKLEKEKQQQEYLYNLLEKFVYYDKLCIKNKPKRYGVSHSWEIFNEMRLYYWELMQAIE